MKRACLLIITIVISLFAINNTSAIGIGPPRLEIDFTPNLEQDIEYVILNNIKNAVNVGIYVKGDLSQYITLDTASVILSPGERTIITAFLRLPEKIDIPGIHDIRIGALSSPLGAAAGTVGAKAGVESQLAIFVPYEGKYLAAEIKATSVEIGETADFTIYLSNKGLEDINNIASYIDIYLADQTDQLTATVSTESKSLKAEEEDELHATWSTTGAAAGKYKAIATITYDSEVKEVQTTFTVGKALVEISNITVSKFSKGEIAKITVKAKSHWNKQIKDIYATIDIFDKENKLIKTLESSHADIDALSEKELDLFFDTKDISAGEYNAKATLHYLDQKTEKEFIITVKKKATALIILLIIIIVAVLAYVLWRWKRYGKQKGKKTKAKKK